MPLTNVHLNPKYRSDTHYTTVERGGITEELYTSSTAINSVRAGEPFPEGTVITMDDFRKGELTRILVMEKRSEWAELSKAGSWQFRTFNPDGFPDLSDNGTRCQSCHASQASNDFVFTRERMK